VDGKDGAGLGRVTKRTVLASSPQADYFRILPESYSTATATCRQGETVVGGGFFDIPKGRIANVYTSGASHDYFLAPLPVSESQATGDGWRVRVYNPTVIYEGPPFGVFAMRAANG
jgi:hypothetical protein